MSKNPKIRVAEPENGAANDGSGMIQKFNPTPSRRLLGDELR